MPFAVLKSIREVSSEDKLHCAANLLKNESLKKWKTGEAGEKSAYVIIEMESAYSIKGIDIGNEYSAFVEVLVGGPTCVRENFKEILITCSFMTPTESKTSSTPNRVRCFNREALVKEVADEKWKLVKIVCTQPFNRDVKYGLSFIKIHVDGPGDTKKTKELDNLSQESALSSRSFTLREDSPESESESTSALFNRWKGSRNKEPQAVSTIPRVPSPGNFKKFKDSYCMKRAASPATASIEKKPPNEDAKLPDRNRNSLLFTDDNEQAVVRDKRKERLEKAIAADQERVTKEKEKATKKHDKSREEKPRKESFSKPESSSGPSTPSTSRKTRPSSSPCLSEKVKKPKLDKPVKYKPFNQLLNGVVLVISGIQNPDRATLRSKALALGAKYKPDWDDNCTHLICAFKNTPKYNQVKGVGKIITRSWIEDCHSQKKLLPWRRFALDSTQASKPESDEEILDESLKPPESEPTNSRRNTDESDDVCLLYDTTSVNHSQVISSGSDTEDEIQKVLAATSPKKKFTQTRDIYEVSTEEEDYVAKKKKKINEESDDVSKKKASVPDKTTFFKNLKFFVSDQLSAVEKIKVERCIQAYEGVLTSEVDEANYLIALKRIPDVGEFKGETVTPLWILECNDSELLIPSKRYLVT